MARISEKEIIAMARDAGASDMGLDVARSVFALGLFKRFAEAVLTKWGKSPQAAESVPSVEDLCARIKAADDAAADRDYMLDSDDCIAVLRGTWTGPMSMDKPAKPEPQKAQAAEPVGEVYRYGKDSRARVIGGQQTNMLSDHEIDAVTLSQWGTAYGRPLAAHRAYARAIEVESRKQDEALIRQLVEALEESCSGKCNAECRPCCARRAINSARNRLRAMT